MNWVARFIVETLPLLGICVLLVLVARFSLPHMPVDAAQIPLVKGMLLQWLGYAFGAWFLVQSLTLLPRRFRISPMALLAGATASLFILVVVIALFYPDPAWASARAFLSTFPSLEALLRTVISMLGFDYIRFLSFLAANFLPLLDSALALALLFLTYLLAPMLEPLMRWLAQKGVSPLVGHEQPNWWLNRTGRWSLGAMAIASFALVLLVAFIRHQPPGSSQVELANQFLEGFPWRFTAGALLLLGFIGQAMRLGEAGYVLGVRKRSVVSVRPVYDAFLADAGRQLDEEEDKAEARDKNKDAANRGDDLGEWLLLDRWRDGERHESSLEAQEEWDRALERLLEGHTLFCTGNLNARLCAFIAEALQRVQDRGACSIVVCPREHAEKLHQTLVAFNHSLFPDEVFSYRILRSEHLDEGSWRNLPESNVSVLVVEEEAFLEVFGGGMPDFTWRCELLVLLGLQSMDACMLHSVVLGMRTDNELPERMGLFILSRPRRGLDTLAANFLGRVGGAPENWQPDPPPVAGEGLLVWKASEGLRRALLARAGVPREEMEDPGQCTTPAFLVLARSRNGRDGANGEPDLPEEMDLERLVIGMPPVPQDVRELHDMRGTAQRPLLPKFQKSILWHCGRAPFVSACVRRQDGNLYFQENRIIVLQDEGNLAEALNATPRFWGVPEHDYLLHVVVTGYLGSRYMVDRCRQGMERALRRLEPFAQHLGVGVNEVAWMIAERMRRDAATGQDGQCREERGISELEAERFLDMLSESGDLRRQLGITPTRPGLLRLFDLVAPGAINDIETYMGPGQYIHYALPPGTGMHLLGERHCRVILEDAPNDDEGARYTLAAGDHGLIYLNGVDLRFGEHFYNVEEVNIPNRVVRVKNLGRELDEAPTPQYLFRRHYRLEPVKCGDVCLFPELQERRGLDLAHGVPLRTLRVLCNIRRTTDWMAQLSSDIEPTPDILRKSSFRLDEPVTASRRLCQAMVLGLEFLRGEVWRDDELRALAASLQVVLRLSFPRLANRVVVFPLFPEKRPAEESRNEKRSEGEEATSDNVGPPEKEKGVANNTSPGEESAGRAEELRPYFEVLYPRGELSTEGLDAGHNAVLCEITADYPAIVILEDADGDIGVCRQIENQGRAEHLLWRWHDHLHWAVENDAENWVVPGLVDASRAVRSRLFERLEDRS